MNVSEWIEKHGTPDLQRALKEGYAVDMGIGELILEKIEDSVQMPMHFRWRSAEERTSPRSDSFDARDKVVEVVKETEIPEGWICDVSKIKRITLDHGKRTGVIVQIHNDERKHVVYAAVDFEGKPHVD